MDRLAIIALLSVVAPVASAQVSAEIIRAEANRYALAPCLEVLEAAAATYTDAERIRSIRTLEMRNLINDVMSFMRVLSTSDRMDIYQVYRRACIEGRLNED